MTIARRGVMAWLAVGRRGGEFDSLPALRAVDGGGCGTAPLPIKFLWLDERPTNEWVTWGSVTNWSMTNRYPLVMGPNQITLSAAGWRTNFVAMTNITITRQ